MLVAALSTGRMPLSELVRDLGADGEVLRGGGGGAVLAFALREPLGTAVESDRPRFRWERFAAARAYVVTVYDEDFARVARSPEVTSPEWTCDRPLARGKSYTWQVTALTASGDPASSRDWLRHRSRRARAARAVCRAHAAAGERARAHA